MMALGQTRQGPACGTNPRWVPSAFNKKALWCMCGAGDDYGRCPGCCGPCPACPPRRCQQPSYKVFDSAQPAFDCLCGPCAPGGALGAVGATQKPSPWGAVAVGLLALAAWALVATPEAAPQAPRTRKKATPLEKMARIQRRARV